MKKFVTFRTRRGGFAIVCNGEKEQAAMYNDVRQTIREAKYVRKRETAIFSKKIKTMTPEEYYKLF